MRLQVLQNGLVTELIRKTTLKPFDFIIFSGIIGLVLHSEQLGFRIDRMDLFDDFGIGNQFFFVPLVAIERHELNKSDLKLLRFGQCNKI